VIGRRRRAAVHRYLDAQVEVGLRAGDGGAEIVVGVADLDDRGVVAVDLNDGRGVRGGCCLITRAAAPLP
jgi:hypothetical protein